MTSESLILTERLAATEAQETVDWVLALTAEERQRSHYRVELEKGPVLFLRLPRGTVLQQGDRLRSPTGQIVRIAAKLEPVMTVTANHIHDLLRAAYHLGNRHVSLEITSTYLRLTPDPVLRQMLHQQGLQVREEIQPFFPEAGAYHSHSHDDRSETADPDTPNTYADSHSVGKAHS